MARFFNFNGKEGEHEKHRKITFKLWRLITALIVTFSVTIMYGCGGGGGGGGTNPETFFPLHAPDEFVPGYKLSGTHSGTVKVDGTSYNETGTFSVQTWNIVFLNDFGVNTIPIETFFTINVPQIAMNLTILSTVYVNADSGNFEPVFSEDNNGQTGVPLEINLTPDVAQVGDFGKDTSWSYNNGWTETGTWSLESSAPGFANLVITGNIYDSLNNLISVGKITSKINELGEPVAIIYFQVLYTEGVEINISGNVS